jgi:hypothetical protein
MLHWLVSCLFLAGGQDLTELDRILDRKGTLREDVVRFAFPRSDLHVEIAGVRLEPAFALTTCAAFTPMGKHAPGWGMVMGDFVVTEAELPRAQKALLQGGLTVTGVHNHLAGESPGMLYMHYAGKGELSKLAQALVGALRMTGTPLGPPPAPLDIAAPDWSKVEEILGHTGGRNGRVLNVSVPKPPIRHEGEPLPIPMGGASSINFQWIEPGKVAVTSDLVLFPDEVEPVVRALHAAEIPITALHNHMVYDEPRTFHLHVFAIGEPEALAAGMRKALNRM